MDIPHTLEKLELLLDFVILSVHSLDIGGGGTDDICGV